VSLLRRLQPRGTEDEEEAAAAEIAGLQVLLCGSRQFGPASLRELTVRGADLGGAQAMRIMVCRAQDTGCTLC